MRKDSKLFKAVQALGGVSEYPAPKRSEYPSWVVDLFAARGRRISYDGATALVLAVGRDLRRLETETEKVLAYAGERVELTRDDVVSVVSETAPVSVFDFLNAVGARDCSAALTLLGDLIADGQDLMGIHAMTVRQLRTLVSARALVDRGASAGRSCEKSAWPSGRRRPPWRRPGGSPPRSCRARSGTLPRSRVRMKSRPG